jgi:hypothetical protein
MGTHAARNHRNPRSRLANAQTRTGPHRPDPPRRTAQRHRPLHPLPPHPGPLPALLEPSPTRRGDAGWRPNQHAAIHHQKSFLALLLCPRQRPLPKRRPQPHRRPRHRRARTAKFTQGPAPVPASRGAGCQHPRRGRGFCQQHQPLFGRFWPLARARRGAGGGGAGSGSGGGAGARQQGSEAAGGLRRRSA